MTNRNKKNDKKLNLLSNARGGFFDIHVKGHLDKSWSEWLEGLEVKLLDNGEMVLSGHIVDQAALMGILTRLHNLNLTLLSMNKVDQNKRCQK